MSDLLTSGSRRLRLDAISGHPSFTFYHRLATLLETIEDEHLPEDSRILYEAEEVAEAFIFISNDLARFNEGTLL